MGEEHGVRSWALVVVRAADALLVEWRERFAPARAEPDAPIAGLGESLAEAWARGYRAARDERVGTTIYPGTTAAEEGRRKDMAEAWDDGWASAGVDRRNPWRQP